MSLELRNSTGHVIPVKNLSEPISLFAATGQTPSVPSLVLVSHERSVYHMLNVDKNDTSLHFEVTPQDPNTELIVYLKRGMRPTQEDYDFRLVLPDEPPVNTTFPKDRHMFYISNADTNHTTAGTWYLGVYYNGTLTPQYIMDSQNIPKLFIPKKVNYTLRMYSSGCLFWDEENDRWSGDGCVVSMFKILDLVFTVRVQHFLLRVQNFSLRVQSYFVFKVSYFVFKVSHFVFKVTYFVFKISYCSKFLRIQILPVRVKNVFSLKACITLSRLVLKVEWTWCNVCVLI